MQIILFIIRRILIINYAYYFKLQGIGFYQISSNANKCLNAYQ